MDTMGDRFKRYEAVGKHRLTPKVPVIVRIDGRAFHSYTKTIGFLKPFDEKLRSAMLTAATTVAYDMMGFTLAYHQSDEVSFLLRDDAELQTEPWFDNKIEKIVSLAASLFTADLNLAIGAKYPYATFDARAFNVPLNDVPNYFVWRQKDWTRNSLQMLARTHFSHKELHGKNAADMHEMLHTVGVNWADLAPHWRNGTYLPNGHGFVRSDILPVYAQIAPLCGIELPA